MQCRQEPRKSRSNRCTLSVSACFCLSWRVGLDSFHAMIRSFSRSPLRSELGFWSRKRINQEARDLREPPPRLGNALSASYKSQPQQVEKFNAFTTAEQLLQRLNS